MKMMMIIIIIDTIIMSKEMLRSKSTDKNNAHSNR